jgi:cyclic-di-GMP-binding protein
MPSFDIVSKLEKHEVTNAIDQANRELINRFDFKGTDSVFELKEYVVTLKTKSDFQLKQMLEILKPRLLARGIDVKCIEEKDPVINLGGASQEVTLRQGIEQKTGKEIQKIIKEAKLKVEAQINGDKLRVQGKKRDDLQDAMAVLRKAELDMPLQFENFRD